MNEVTHVTDIDNDDLTCPITLELFRDPVRAQDGHVYEREAITRWIQEHGTSPFTRQPLQIHQLQPDNHLKTLAKQRRNSIVSYNVQKSAVVLPLRRILRKYPTQIAPNLRRNRITPMNQLKNCIFQSIVCRIFMFLIAMGIPLGLILGLTHSNFYPNKTTTKADSPNLESVTRYSSTLTANSTVFIRPWKNLEEYYYEAISVIIFTAGYYRFKSISSIDMFGYLYTSSFSATNPTSNILVYNDDSGGFQQFSFLILLSVGNYTLVATTFNANITGNFSIVVEGSASVSLQ